MGDLSPKNQEEDDTFKWEEQTRRGYKKLILKLDLVLINWSEGTNQDGRRFTMHTCIGLVQIAFIGLIHG